MEEEESLDGEMEPTPNPRFTTHTLTLSLRNASKTRRPNGPKLYIDGAESKVNGLPMACNGVSTISAEEGQPTEPSLS